MQGPEDTFIATLRTECLLGEGSEEDIGGAPGGLVASQRQGLEDESEITRLRAERLMEPVLVRL